MELSAELFEQTIRMIKGDGVVIKKQRREHPRVGVRSRIRIMPVEAGAAGKPLDVWTRDISRSGIGVISAQRIEVGQRFVVHFPRSDGTAPLALLCKITCCTALSKGAFSIGAAFEEVKKPDSAAA